MLMTLILNKSGYNILNFLQKIRNISRAHHNDLRIHVHCKDRNDLSCFLFYNACYNTDSNGWNDFFSFHLSGTENMLTYISCPENAR